MDMGLGQAIGLGGQVMGMFGGSGAEDAASAMASGAGQAAALQKQFAEKSIEELKKYFKLATDDLNKYYGISREDLAKGQALSRQDLARARETTISALRAGRDTGKAALDPFRTTGLEALDMMSDLLGMPRPKEGSATFYKGMENQLQQYYDTQQDNLMKYNADYDKYTEDKTKYDASVKAYNDYQNWKSPDAGGLIREIKGTMPGWWAGSEFAGNKAGLVGFRDTMQQILNSGQVGGPGAGPIPGQDQVNQLNAAIARINKELPNYERPAAVAAPGEAPIEPTKPSLSAAPIVASPEMVTDSVGQQQSFLDKFYNSPSYKLLYGDAPKPGQTFVDIMRADPGYQFSIDEAAKARNRAASAGGYLNSPRLQLELQRDAQGIADTKINEYRAGLSSTFDKHIAQISALAGIGANAGGQISSQNVGTNTAIGQANANTGAAQSQIAYNTGTQNANLAANQGSNLANVNMNLGSKIADVTNSIGDAQANSALAIGRANAAGAIGAANDQNAFASNLMNAGQYLQDNNIGNNLFQWH